MGSQEKKGDKWMKNKKRNWTLSSTDTPSRFVSRSAILSLLLL